MKLHILVAAVALAGTPVYAQDKTAEVDKIFSWAKPDAPGCVVAASQNGKLVLSRAYGSADLERGVPLTASSVMDVASVVKQFVAASTLLLVEEGKLSLSEDVHKYIPELPAYGHKITLDHLLTHTSGIRDWTGLGPLTGREIDALTVTLRQRGLNFAPGEEWAYSNGGYVLLKEIVARVSGMSFAEFARKRLFEPLGMKSTSYVVDIERGIANRALAYEKNGNAWRQDMQVGNQRGGGGALFSTASDLLIWNDALVNARLGKFVTGKLHEPAKLNNGRTLTYARGLHIDSARGDKVIWHSGGSAGYSSMLARHPAHGVSVAVTCNAGDSAPSSQYARRVFDLLLPAAAAPAPAPAAGSAQGIDVSSSAGLFFNERTGEPLRLVAAGGRLRIQDAPPLDTIAADRFRNPRGVLSVLSQAAFDLHFVSPDAFELRTTEGQVTRYRRAEAFAPSAAELQAFAGRYDNGETSAVFEITPGTRGVMVKLNALGPLEFLPVDRDRFQLGGMILHFRRDTAGAIVGIDYSNPVVRNVAFNRIK